jgi:hypothetical protein
VTETEIFVAAAGFHLAHPELGGDVGGVFDGCLTVGGKDDFERGAAGLDNALGKTADYLQPLGVDVEEPEFINWKNGRAL